MAELLIKLENVWKTYELGEVELVVVAFASILMGGLIYYFFAPRGLEKKKEMKMLRHLCYNGLIGGMVLLTLLVLFTIMLGSLNAD